MKLSKVYDYDGKKVEFAEIEGDVYVFYRDINYLSKMGEINKSIPYYSNDRLERYFGEDSVCLYRGKSKNGKVTRTNTHTALIRSSSIIKKLKNGWGSRDGAGDMLSFIQLADEDFRRQVIGRVPNNNSRKDAEKHQQQDNPVRKGVSERIDHLTALVQQLQDKLDKIDLQNNTSTEVIQIKTKEKGFFRRLFS